MAKGTEAKAIVEKKIQECFGQDFVGVVDKKLYVNIKESNGEIVQVAISMTCPKTMIGEQPVQNLNKLEFDDEPKTAPIIDDEERNNILKMMQKLGL